MIFGNIVEKGEDGDGPCNIIAVYVFCSVLNPLPDEKILDWSKLKEIADKILKCIESEK